MDVTDPNFHRLAESPRFILGHMWEDAFLVSRDDGEALPLGCHHGDPTAGLIAPDESWCLTAGEGLVLVYLGPDGPTVREFWRGSASDVRFVHSVRADEPDGAALLLDPWSEYASVWRLDVRTGSLTKVRDGPHLGDEPYRDEVAF